jgi:pyruvate/2-oxoglutarate dehydrogenase complex dihydrolipoamide dehydrogenase (E3) component
MKYDYDVIVLGAGSAGLNIAGFSNAVKLKTLMVEKHLVGGDCLNWGCVPSKALLSIAHAVHQSRKADAFGFHVVGGVDMEKVAKTIRTRQDVIREHENPDYLRDKGMDVEIGEPRFISGNAVAVNGKEFYARRIVIATGSRPAVPNIKELENIDYMTNETFFANRELPEKLLIIGAGPIGIEMAQAYQRLGAQVTVLDLEERILPREDRTIANSLQSILEKEGVSFKLGVKPLHFTSKHDLLISPLKKKEENGETLTFDQVLIATGRQLNIDGLDLEKAGIDVNHNRIVLDEYLRTSNKKVYCCGDAAGDFLFTHWAEYQAAIVLRNMFSPFKKKVNRGLIARVTYTDPEIAAFGFSPYELVERGVSYKTISVPVKELDRAVCEGIGEGVLNIHLAKGKIVGGTLMAKHAGELIGEAVSFMTLKLPFSHLYNRIYPYPTFARIHRKAVQKYLGEKLTPWNSRILRKLFRIFNR